MSNENLRKYEKEVLQLSEKRQKLLQIFFSNQLLILGSYTETRMRCSSPGCHCHKDGGHPTMRISYWDKGKLKSKVVRIDDRQWVAEAAANYKGHKQALRDIAELNIREKEVLKMIIELKAQIYE
jgi:hypothetical protein